MSVVAHIAQYIGRMKTKGCVPVEGPEKSVVLIKKKLCKKNEIDTRVNNKLTHNQYSIPIVDVSELGNS